MCQHLFTNVPGTEISSYDIMASKCLSPSTRITSWSTKNILLHATRFSKNWRHTSHTSMLNCYQNPRLKLTCKMEVAVADAIEKRLCLQSGKYILSEAVCWRAKCHKLHSN